MGGTHCCTFGINWDCPILRVSNCKSTWCSVSLSSQASCEAYFLDILPWPTAQLQPLKSPFDLCMHGYTVVEIWCIIKPMVVYILLDWTWVKHWPQTLVWFESIVSPSIHGMLLISRDSDVYLMIFFLKYSSSIPQCEFEQSVFTDNIDTVYKVWDALNVWFGKLCISHTSHCTIWERKILLTEDKW